MNIILIILLEIFFLLVFNISLNMYFFSIFSIDPRLYFVFIFKNYFNLTGTAIWISAIAFIILVLDILAFRKLFFKSIRKNNRLSGNHGTSRWATLKEYKKLGFLSKTPDGVILGQTNEATFKLKIKKEKIEIKQNQDRKNALNDIKTEEEKKNDKETLEQYKNEKIYKTEIKKIYTPKRYGKYYIRHNLDGHTLAVGATRSGKGIGTIIPTLLSLKESVMVLDVKSENFKLTSGARSKFSKVIKWDVKDVEHSCSFNPLLWISRGGNAIRDIQNITTAFIPQGDGTGQKHGDFFTKTSRNVLELLIGHVLLFENEKTLSKVANIANEGEGQSPLKFFSGLVDAYEHVEVQEDLKPLFNSSQILAKELFGTAQDSPETFDNIFTTFKTKMTAFNRPEIQQLTATNTFEPEEFFNGDLPLSLYLCVPPGDIDSLDVVIRVVFTMIFKKLTETDATVAKNHKLLMILDEFTQLGYMQVVETAMPLTAGFGIYFLIIIQSFDALKAIYKKATDMLNNFEYKIFLKSNDDETARKIKTQLGNKSVLQKRTNDSGKAGDLILDKISNSYTEQGVALMQLEDLLRIDFEDQLILMSNTQPYKAKKVMSYNHRVFAPLTKISPFCEAFKAKDPRNWHENHFFVKRKLIEFMDNKGINAVRDKKDVPLVNLGSPVIKGGK